jgi:uncharacterized lipoprotein
MKQMLVAALVLTLFAGCASTVSHEVQVQAYTRADGTHIKAHVSTPPDALIDNNYSHIRR